MVVNEFFTIAGNVWMPIRVNNLKSLTTFQESLRNVVQSW